MHALPHKIAAAHIYFDQTGSGWYTVAFQKPGIFCSDKSIVSVSLFSVNLSSGGHTNRGWIKIITPSKFRVRAAKSSELELQEIPIVTETKLQSFTMKL